jgi:hypothetical protein
MLKKEPCPPFHRRYPTTGKCELLKIYQLKRKSNDETHPDYFIRLMPEGLRNLLSDEKFENEYVINKENCKIEIYQDRTIKNRTIKNIMQNIPQQQKIFIRKPKIKILPSVPVTEKKTDIIKIKKKKANLTHEEFDESYLDHLYPRMNDTEFSIKISNQKQFNDTQYDGNIYNIKEQSDKLCNTDFELMPHQLFVKNFMSFNTPYNSLLLYHGLGSGKTCSAIGVSEEMRSYMKQVGINREIMVIASPNVQDNFRLQLFDERKLKYENGIWNLNSCVGTELLKEINPTIMKDIPKAKIISQIKNLINKNYVFMGYTQLANFISSKIETIGLSKINKKSNKIKKIQSIFDNRLIIIDEVHNIRLTSDNKNVNKKCAELLMEVVKYTNNLRLLLLSATPMYNSHEEIIWITNLMNLNDKRSQIKINDVFNENGDFRTDENKGYDLLKRKLTGYVSYVRGENPFLFPIRIYNENSKNKLKKLPTIQLNKTKIKNKMENIHKLLFVNKITDYQRTGYEFIIKTLRNKYKDIFKKVGDKSSVNVFDSMESFGYLLLQKLIEALNIVYPTFNFNDKKTSGDEDIFVMETIIGKNGLNDIMKYKEHLWTKEQPYYLHYNFDYKSEKHGKIFSPGEIHKYSSKISNICKKIKESTGIILIYSQYIDGGAVPTALALEEMGFTRFGSESYTKPLLKERSEDPIEPIDSLTMETQSDYKGDQFKQAQYVMITGDKIYSPNNINDIKYLNDENNKYGKNVKVVIISKAAAEGIDFKNIRQVHILEPWFNMNRIEQIIGRGVRNLSHCKLPFEERNVEIFLHSSTLEDNQEATDLYIYRLAEQKAKKIGRITRLLKEISVDCVLNIKQNNFTYDNLSQITENQDIEVTLPNGKKTTVQYGDKPYTDICDYMDNCEYSCGNKGNSDVSMMTYNNSFIIVNHEKIVKRIKDLFRDIPGQYNGRYFFKRDELINSINISNKYSHEQIYSALNYLIEKNDYLIDKYGRYGYLENKGLYYLFKPIEITENNASIFERSIPIDIKIPNVAITLKDIKFKTDDINEYNEIYTSMKENFDNVFLDKISVSIGEKNWYKNYSVILEHLKEQYNFNDTMLKKYCVFHNLDTLPFSDKIVLLNTIYHEWVPSNEIEIYIKQYFDELMIISDISNDNFGFVLSEDNINYKIYVKSDGFNKATLTQSEDLIKSSEYMNKFLILNKSIINNTIGFMAPYNDEFIFKTRDLQKIVNKKGAIMLQAQAKEIIKQLNDILGNQDYILDNIKEDEGKSKSKVLCKLDNIKYGKNKIVVLLEILMRFFQDENKQGKIWFLSNEKMLINKIYDFQKKN